MCSLCGFKSFDPKAKADHSCLPEQARKDGNLAFRCEFCGLAFVRHITCCMHGRAHDRPAEKTKCPIPDCDLMFWHSSNLEKHVRKKHVDGQPTPKPQKQEVQCQVCGKILASKQCFKVR